MKAERNSTGGGHRRPWYAPAREAVNGGIAGLDVLGGVVVLAMMVVVNLDVFGRWLFNFPLHGTLELSEMGIVAIVYLQIAYAVRARRLTRSDSLLVLLRKKMKYRTERTLRFLFNICGAIVFAVICFGQYPRLIASWSGGYFKGNEGVFTAPLWPLDAIILIGSALACLQFIFLATRNLRSVPQEHPGE